MTRRRLGRDNGFGQRSRLYMADDAFDVDELEGYRRVRQRIFFDDVLLVTMHRERSVIDWVGGLGGVGLSIVLVALAVGAGMDEEPAGVIAAALLITCAALVGTLGLVSVARGRMIVAIFGRRTMGRAAFVYRHANARETFALVVDRVRAAQARMARDLPPPEAPPADEVPG